mmetsp:Transcript_39130/g.91164  ORF Transcript_39130/g.91164 Transcript_39130/m.91164 type:complete len:91 (-) Transcript_39130:583-855(-)
MIFILLLSQDCKALGKISVCDGPGPFGMCECKCKTEESEKCVYAKNGGEICGCEKPCKKETDASVCTGKKGKLKCKCKVNSSLCLWRKII